MYELLPAFFPTPTRIAALSFAGTTLLFVVIRLVLTLSFRGTNRHLQLASTCTLIRLVLTLFSSLFVFSAQDTLEVLPFSIYGLQIACNTMFWFPSNILLYYLFEKSEPNWTSKLWRDICIACASALVFLWPLNRAFRDYIFIDEDVRFWIDMSYSVIHTFTIIATRVYTAYMLHVLRSTKIGIIVFGILSCWDAAAFFIGTPESVVIATSTSGWSIALCFAVAGGGLPREKSLQEVKEIDKSSSIETL